MSQIKRIIPSEMMGLNLPEAPINAQEATVKTDKVVTARVENTEYGVCPICHKPMKTTTANGIPVHACMEHRIVMPLRNEA